MHLKEVLPTGIELSLSPLPKSSKRTAARGGEKGWFGDLSRSRKLRASVESTSQYNEEFQRDRDPLPGSTFYICPLNDSQKAIKDCVFQMNSKVRGMN